MGDASLPEINPSQSETVYQSLLRKLQNPNNQQLLLQIVEQASRGTVQQAGLAPANSLPLPFNGHIVAQVPPQSLKRAFTDPSPINMDIIAQQAKRPNINQGGRSDAQSVKLQQLKENLVVLKRRFKYYQGRAQDVKTGMEALTKQIAECQNEMQKEGGVSTGTAAVETNATADTKTVYAHSPTHIGNFSGVQTNVHAHGVSNFELAQQHNLYDLNIGTSSVAALGLNQATMQQIASMVSQQPNLEGGGLQSAGNEEFTPETVKQLNQLEELLKQYQTGHVQPVEDSS